MNINKNHVKTLLNALVDAYPHSVESFRDIEKEIGEFTPMIAHLIYLKDHGYIEGNFEFFGNKAENPWVIDFDRIRINAKGLDYAEELNNVSGGMIRRHNM